MRFKTVPPAPPDELTADSTAEEALAIVRDALPLVPRSEEDCCGRLVDRVDWIEERDVATEWIGFLRALGLAERSDAGYSRVRGDVDRDEVATRFQDRIVAVDAAIAALDDDPRTAAAVFDAIGDDVVPEWERRRSDTWRDAWLDRTERLLGWAVLLGLAARTEDGYRLAASPD